MLAVKVKQADAQARIMLCICDNYQKTHALAHISIDDITTLTSHCHMICMYPYRRARACVLHVCVCNACMLNHLEWIYLIF